MEKIIYNKTLDVHKSGVQFTLQGFETVDKFARRIALSLSASGDAIDLPAEQLEVLVYTKVPSKEEQSIDRCVVNGNTIIYDMPPIAEEGVTELQLKLIETSPEGAKSVLGTPRFAVEVSKSNAEDESVKQTTTYTALEEAIARARGVYEARLLRIALDEDCVFCAYYADGTVYESDVLKELFLQGDALLSKSFAKGGTGVRDGEDTDNARYYSNVAKSASEDTTAMTGSAKAILDEVKLHGVYTAFEVNFETGEIMYLSPKYKFVVNAENGNLEIEGKAYTFEQGIGVYANEWFLEQGIDVATMKVSFDKQTEELDKIREDAQEQKEEMEAIRTRTDKYRPIWNVLYGEIENRHTNVLAISPNRKYFCKRIKHNESENQIALCRTEDSSVVGTYAMEGVCDVRIVMDNDTVVICGALPWSGSNSSYSNGCGFADNSSGLHRAIKYAWKFLEYNDSEMEELVVEATPDSNINGESTRIPVNSKIISEEEGGEGNLWFLVESLASMDNIYGDRTHYLRVYLFNKKSKTVQIAKQWEVDVSKQQSQEWHGRKYKLYQKGDDAFVAYPGAGNAKICVDRFSFQDGVLGHSSVCEISVSGEEAEWAYDTKNSIIITNDDDKVRTYDLDGNLLRSIDHADFYLRDVLDGVAYSYKATSSAEERVLLKTVTLEKSNGIYASVEAVQPILTKGQTSLAFACSEGVYDNEIFDKAYMSDINPLSTLYLNMKKVTIGGWIEE